MGWQSQCTTRECLSASYASRINALRAAARTAESLSDAAPHTSYDEHCAKSDGDLVLNPWGNARQFKEVRSLRTGGKTTRSGEWKQEARLRSTTTAPLRTARRPCKLARARAERYMEEYGVSVPRR
jgi:hypothetical protein